MKTTLNRLRAVRTIGALLGIPISLLSAEPAPQFPRPPTSPSTYPSFPWSESSDTVRVSKAALQDVDIPALAFTNRQGALAFTVSSGFIQAFQLTEAEATRINRALAAAFHEYRTVEGRNLKPIEDPGAVRSPFPYKPPTVEEVSFRLVPFPKEAAMIRWKLESEILNALGPFRARTLLFGARIHFKSAMDTFVSEEPAPLGVRALAIPTSSAEPIAPEPRVETSAKFHTFFLRGSTQVPHIDRDVTGPNGGYGGEYPEELDRYAPETMKPVLARWRKAIRDGTVPPGTTRKPLPPERKAPPAATNVTSGNPAPDPEEYKAPTSPPAGSPIFTHTPWDEASEHVDVSKRFVGSLGLPLLTWDWVIVPEVAALLGLDGTDQSHLANLVKEFETRFEGIERKHLERVEPGKNRFIVRPFPREKAVLEAEWLKRLAERFGEGRARFMDRAIRLPGADPVWRSLRRGESLQDSPIHRGPTWLGRGVWPITLTVTGERGALRSVEWSVEDPIGESGSTGGKNVPVPERFRHLLTHETLDPSKPL